MNNIMIKIFRSSLLSSIGLAILGALLIYQSEITIVSISYIIGALLVAIGALSLLKFIKNINNNQKNELDVVYGVVTIILGIIVIGNPQAIASIIPFVIGIIIIINSTVKLQYSLELKKNKNNLWKSTITLSLVTFFCGMLLIFNPFKGAVVITKLIGILILIYAILDIISTITIKKTVKKIHNAIEEHIVEADIIEETKDNEHNNKSKQKNKKEDNHD